MKKEEFKELILCSSNEKVNYPDIFTEDCGLDIFNPSKKTHAIPSWGANMRYKIRRVIIEISTYRGISFNAKHYYGKLIVDGVHMEYDDTPGKSNMDFAFEKEEPLSGYKYDLFLKRRITKEDIEKYPDDFGDYEIKDLTNRFNSKQEIIDLALKVFKHRFIGNWDLYLKDIHGNIKKLKSKKLKL